MKIELELHRDGNLLVLDSKDIYKYIGEETKADLDFAYYIDQWCQYLNYSMYNSETAFGSPQKSLLKGWIDGYNFAKKIEPKYEKGFIVFQHGKYSVTLNEPFEF